MRKIAHIQGTPWRERDLRWLAEALQAAVEIELATIPPYLTAWWSVEDDATYQARSLREIVEEEMAHMAIAMNLLVSLGPDYHPAIVERAPVYPTPLPRGIRPHLTVQLESLSEESLLSFIEIERGDEEEQDIELCHTLGEEHASISRFYRDVFATFESLRPEIHVERQIHGHLSPLVVTSLDDVERAVDAIVVQGEGSSLRNPQDTGPDDLAHVWRFREISVGKRYQYDPILGQWDFIDPIPEAEIACVPPVPRGGYTEGPAELARFDRAYTNMLRALELAWRAPVGRGQGSLTEALEAMFGMGAHARALMRKKLPGKRTGFHGPAFRILDQA